MGFEVAEFSDKPGSQDVKQSQDPELEIWTCRDGGGIYHYPLVI